MDVVIYPVKEAPRVLIVLARVCKDLNRQSFNKTLISSSWLMTAGELATQETEEGNHSIGIDQT